MIPKVASAVGKRFNATTSFAKIARNFSQITVRYFL